MIITKKDLSSALYLSCVENYFRAWISKYYSVEKLYSNSFISMKEVLSAFYCGASYENYSAIERIQETAERNGVVNHLIAVGDTMVVYVDIEYQKRKVVANNE